MNQFSDLPPGYYDIVRSPSVFRGQWLDELLAWILQPVTDPYFWDEVRGI